MITAGLLKEKFGLVKHPEGGYYTQTYKSVDKISDKCLPGRFSGDRFIATAIYFLLEAGDFSAFHRIKSDECWHFYTGHSLIIYQIDQAGEMQTISLGNNLERGDVFQFVVPAGCWFASEPASHSEFSFVGCTVSPGFDFEDFELASAANLGREYPMHSGIINRLTRQ
ncbi:MAG TPA: cupin domain-containing protein [Chitinophagaceae bacterium]|nr:cupin domain-containing protein [Chitinophagaceae bacterium]